MALKANDKFAVDATHSYVGKKREFEGDTFESEVGDVKSEGQFYPQLKIKRWNNEANFSVRLKDSRHVEPTIDGDKVVYDTPEYRACFYYLDQGFEFDILEHAKRARKLEFSLRHKGLRFLYQDPVRLQEKFDYYTKMGCDPEIPEDVYGSYAVYHETKVNNQYRAGKAFHIKRPWARDKNGWKVWLDLHIDPDTNLMSMTYPQAFYDNAIWPVYVDPTFGYTTAGASNASSINNRGYGHGNSSQQYTASSGDQVTTLHFYTRNTNDTADCGIYDLGTPGSSEDGATLLSGNATITATGTTPVWETASVTIDLTNGNGHFCAYATGNGIRRYWDTGVAGDSTEDTNASGGALPSTWTETNTDDEIMSFYATYTEGGGGSFTLTADTAAYTYTGTAADVLLGAEVSADSGSYTYTGTAADLQAGFSIDAATGAYTYTGTAADLQASFVLTGDLGVYTYSGTDATLTFAGASDYTLTADSGAYTYTGAAADVQAGVNLSADSGSYTYTGTDAGLTRNFPLSADSGTYTYAGTDVGFLFDAVVVADSGTYTYLGTGVTLSAISDIIAISSRFRIKIPGDSRLFSMPADSRTLNIPGNDRNIKLN